MPILYEDVFPPPAKEIKKFAAQKDDETTLTISLAAGGKGIITEAHAFDPANPAVHLTKATPGQKFSLYLEATNKGDKDYIWIVPLDKDTGDHIKTPEYPSGAYIHTELDAGKKVGWTLANVTMPNKTFNILIQAGHGT
jgi:hypothetical protein